MSHKICRERINKVVPVFKNHALKAYERTEVKRHAFLGTERTPSPAIY
jgi:hypothetical protein